MNEPLVIGTVGRMTPEKNQIQLINIMPELLKLRSDCILLLIGSGPDREKLEDQAIHLGIQEHIVFLGNQQNIYEWLNVLDIFVMPSIFEGFPIAAIEAASNGLPLVLSDTITNELAFLDNVKYIALDENYAAWAATILSMKRHADRNSNDKRKLLNSYDIQSCAKILEKIYVDLNI